MKKHILIVEARFYPEMADALADGAMAELKAAGVTSERIAVPGVLEIPPAIKYASASKKRMVPIRELKKRYDGYIALGVVIRGETSHYDIVCGESARGLMDLGVRYGLAIGNGIQTVENREQAWARCRAGEKNKGGGAAQAVLALLAVRSKMSQYGEA